MRLITQFGKYRKEAILAPIIGNAEECSNELLKAARIQEGELILEHLNEYRNGKKEIVSYLVLESKME